MNPQYHVSLLEPDEAELKKQQRKERRAQIPTCTLLVSLMQRDQRRSRWRGKDFLLIAFNVFQVGTRGLEGGCLTNIVLGVCQRAIWPPKARANSERASALL